MSDPRRALRDLVERWRENAMQPITDGWRIGGPFRQCADELDAVLAQLAEAPPEEKNCARVAPLTAGADGQDLPQSGNEVSPSVFSEKERWMAAHVDRGHGLKKRQHFYECSCGATLWHTFGEVLDSSPSADASLPGGPRQEPTTR